MQRNIPDQSDPWPAGARSLICKSEIQNSENRRSFITHLRVKPVHECRAIHSLFDFTWSEHLRFATKTFLWEKAGAAPDLA